MGNGRSFVTTQVKSKAKIKKSKNTKKGIILSLSKGERRGLGPHVQRTST